MTGIKPKTGRSATLCRVFAVTFVFLSLTLNLNAQTRTVRGSVKDVSGAPVIGATVVAKGTNAGVTTDARGNYSINVPGSASTLVFSFIGYESQSVQLAASQTALDVTLHESATAIEEVVVNVGYGTVRKVDLTGSVASVSSKILENAPVASTAEAIAGRMAGVRVTTAEGSPDADVKIRVRGGGSVTQDNSPLYIVDGFVVSSISDISPSDIQSIDVLKDASTAAIYGSRGANGVVMITTKGGKEGKTTISFNTYLGVKEISKTLDVLNPYEYVLWQYELTRGNTDGIKTFEKYYGAFDDIDLYKPKHGTDWQDEVFGNTGFQQYYNLSVSGGTKATKYNVGLTRNTEDGIMLGSGYERNNITAKLSTELSKVFTMDFNARFALTKVDGAGTSSTGTNSRLKHAIKYAPVNGLVNFDYEDEDSESSSNPSIYYNPVTLTNDDYKFVERRQQVYNVAINYKPVKGLRIRSEWGGEWGNERTDRFYGPSTSQSRNNANGLPIAGIQTKEAERFSNTNTATYDWKDFIKGHDLTFLAGEETNIYNYNTITTEARGFSKNTRPEGAFAMMNMATAQPIVTYVSPGERMLSFFGRVNYSGLDRYLLTVTFRADGSSKFAKGNQWGYFPSAAAAWRISEEKFMKSTHDWLSNLKVRLSYGEAGNNRIADNLWQALYTTNVPSSKYYYIGDVPQNQLIPDPDAGLANPGLKWETTVTRDLGLDAGFFNGRLNATIDLYWNTTKDLLIKSKIPDATGYAYQYKNLGQTSNRGIEITLDGAIIQKKDFNLNASFNISFNKNKIDKLDDPFTASTYWFSGGKTPDADYWIEEGKEIGLIYGYVYDGMYSFNDFTYVPNADPSKAGTWKLNVRDANGNLIPNNQALVSQSIFAPGALKFKKISAENGDDQVLTATGDRTIIGNVNPIHTGGFSLGGNWKAIDFSVFFNWSYGNDIYNANRLEFSGYPDSKLYGNILNDFNSSQRFSYVNKETGAFMTNDPAALQEYNKNATMFSPLFTLEPVHSWCVEDGSFLRLNTVTVGYTLPKKWTSKISISTLRIYVTGYNLYTWTNYSGYDPEVDAFASNPLTPGVDYSAFPRARTFIGGINITF